VHNSKLSPANLNVTKEGDMYCATGLLTLFAVLQTVRLIDFLVDDPSLDSEFYLIRREQNYQSTSGSLYSSGEIVCWYVFASLFLALALLGIATCIGHFYGNL